ncbi:MAG: hypothetical protein AAF389_11040 [Gemmatimonadota bacterium]
MLVDRAVLVLVPLLVAWHIVPHVWQTQEVALVVAVALGVTVPTVVERVFHKVADQTDNVAMLVGLSGLALHALMEGAALAAPGGVDTPFGIAVALHRVPVGLIIWWLIRPRFGWGLASLAVGALIAVTLAGYGLGGELIPTDAAHTHGHTHDHGDADGRGWAELYEAFVSGSLMHVVFHQGRHDHDHGKSTHE